DPSGWFASASGDNATFNISNAWADRINDVNSYIYTSAYTADNGGGGGNWTNWIHDEYTNYMLMGSGAFNRMYGNGATSVARSLTSNPSAANKWRQGLLSIESVRQAGGYYAQVAYTQKYSGPGSITIDNVTYTIQPATGGVANKWISIGAQGHRGYSGSNIFVATYMHYQFGGGKPFDVNTSALDMSGISMRTSEIQNIVKQGSGYINLFNYMKNQTGLALGSVKFNYLGNNTFSLSPDKYDFDIRWDDGNTSRNWQLLLLDYCMVLLLIIYQHVLVIHFFGEEPLQSIFMEQLL
ncbi:MAG TPA: hypothetical protein PKN21_03345, partial [Bacteroidales bacterium]|nr:hypothetical protein [Bacteroidales bacterium]